ncbi:HNH endonuclease signature motif containing protein [Georgenia sp. SUBG003]|uniref:HNH endonuclease signature motif containing protein n=1 Tax=Georgenia sp. SUBG003 TaxID=1497974 RepID=UPI0006939829
MLDVEGVLEWLTEGALDDVMDARDEAALEKFRAGSDGDGSTSRTRGDGRSDAPLTAKEVRTILDDAAGLDGIDLALALAPVDLETLDEGEAVDAVAAWSRVASWAHARRGEAAATLETGLISSYGLTGRSPSARTGSSLPHASTELAMRLGVTRHAAGKIVRTGVLLSGPLAATADALERGEIDQNKAQIIASALEGKALPVTAAVEDIVLPRAPGRTPPQLTQDLTQALLEVDPDGAADRHRSARSKRRVTHARALPDGMASFTAVLPAADAVAYDLALDGAARTARAAGDPRTIDQLRADIFASVGHDALRRGWIGPAPEQLALPGITGAGDAGKADRSGQGNDSGQENHSGQADAEATPTRRSTAAEASGAGTPSPPSAPAPEGGYPIGLVGGAPVQINVAVPLSTLLGGGEPGTLQGYGPIDAATARALAAGGTWRRLVTEPLSGTVLDVGRKKYRPPADLARIIRERDRTCVRPGCSTRATGCELDHIVPASQGGSTSSHNNAAMCTFDHRHKTLGDFRVRRNPDGTFDWTSRTGHQYRRELDGGITYLGRTDVDPAHFLPEAVRPVGIPDPWTPSGPTSDDDPPPF